MLDLEWVLDDDRPPLPTSTLVQPKRRSDAEPWARQAASLLARVGDSDRRAEFRERFEERAAICEYCGELSRDEAEHIAFLEIQGAMQRANEKY